VDATTLTEAWLRRRRRGISFCGFRTPIVQRVQQGIIILTIDKIAQDNPPSRDDSGEGVQQALLKIRGTVANVPLQGAPAPHQEFTPVDTSNIFLAAGPSLGWKVIRRAAGRPGFRPKTAVDGRGTNSRRTPKSGGPGH
jgi:ATP-dependent protease Clp ATPase subunit